MSVSYEVITLEKGGDYGVGDHDAGGSEMQTGAVGR